MKTLTSTNSVITSKVLEEIAELTHSNLSRDNSSNAAYEAGYQINGSGPTRKPSDTLQELLEEYAYQIGQPVEFVMSGKTIKAMGV